jgi:hypothetical protein
MESATMDAESTKFSLRRSTRLAVLEGTPREQEQEEQKEPDESGTKTQDVADITESLDFAGLADTGHGCQDALESELEEAQSQGEIEFTGSTSVDDQNAAKLEHHVNNGLLVDLTGASDTDVEISTGESVEESFYSLTEPEQKDEQEEQKEPDHVEISSDESVEESFYYVESSSNRDEFDK